MFNAKLDLIILDKNPLSEDGFVKFKAREKLRFDELVDAVKKSKYRKIAYNPNAYSKEENKIIRLLAKRSGTDLVDTSSEYANPIDQKDYDFILSGIKYITEEYILTRYSNYFVKADLKLLENKEVLKPAIVLGDAKCYTKSDVLRLTQYNHCHQDWEDFIREKELREAYEDENSYLDDF